MAPLKPKLLDYLKDWRARSGDLSLLWLACAREKRKMQRHKWIDRDKSLALQWSCPAGFSA